MRIYVGGLPYSVDNAELEALFARHGQVSEATVISDPYSGRSKGFGFVEMPADAEARDAIQKLNGTQLGGRTLSVDEARERPSGGGRGQR
ncbi:MAG: RNA-binding protein [Chthonomonadales bacterium]|nr:RNA-binding protein [Chthonomonadales bacterium]